MKRYGESLVRASRDTHDLDVRVARIFNTYGTRMPTDDGRAIPTFRQASTGKDLTGRSARSPANDRREQSGCEANV